MPTLLYTHDSGLEHDTGPGHPERPDRLRAITAALEAKAFQPLLREQAPMGSEADILRIHPEVYMRAIEAAVPDSGTTYLDGDTVVSPGSWEAALHAVGGACAAADEVLEGRARNAFCALRPPGHHAERTQAKGFCLFANAAIAAARARDVHGLGRVAVVDFDVHHGNGTQHLLEADSGFFYASCHEYPLFPGTGAASETGVGNTVNAPLPPMSGGAELRAACERIILPALHRFQPQFLIISAGFDGHARDPLASMQLTGADFSWVTRQLVAVAEAHCGGKLISVLEGGYDLQGLADGVTAHVDALMRDP